MIFERIHDLCKKNGTTPTTVCEEITGSRGNLPTWKKGHVRSDYLIKIARRFNVSTDYLLGLSDFPEKPLDAHKPVVYDESVTRDVLAPSEQTLVERYRAIDDYGRGRVDMRLDVEFERCHGKMEVADDIDVDRQQRLWEKKPG